MKKVFFAVLFLHIVCGGIALAQEGVLFVGGSPLDTYQPRVIVPLLEEAFRRNGIEFKAESYPSARSLMMSNSGEADGELHRVYDFAEVSEGRFPNLVRIESELLVIHLSVFSEDPATINDWSDLKGADVAYQRGRQNAQNYLEKAVKPKHIHPKNSDILAFRMLANGRVGFVVSESFEGQRMIFKNDEFKDIREVGRLKETRIYAYMHKKHRELAKTIAATLEAMKQDGTYSRIVERVRKELLVH